MDAAPVLEPLKRQHADVYSKHWGGVEHRFFLDVGAVVEHGGNVPASMPKELIPYDDHGGSGRSHVLLSACVNESELFYVHFSTENVRGHIADHRHRA